MKNEDRLSCLPDEILSHILSLMPTNFAVRTSILSKRLRYSWTLITNLDFTNNYLYNRSNCFSEIVDRVLKHCKTSQLKSFRLGIMPNSVQKSDLSKWINEAIRLKVCEFDIEAGPTDLLPLGLFTCKTLTKLILVAGFDDCDVFNHDFPPVIMLPALKTLELIAYSYTSSVNLLRFIHDCPVLESLSMNIILPDDIEQTYSINIPTLKQLELQSNDAYFSKVVLNVPNLEYLCVGGYTCRHFVMKDLSSLVEATIHINSLTDDHGLKAQLLKGLSGVKSLSWFTSNIIDFVHSPLPKFPNLKHLDLKGSSISSWLLLNKILESSSELEHLSFEELGDFGWSEPQSVPTCVLTNLKTLQITKFWRRKCDVQFLEYILGNAAVLETLTIICGSLLLKKERKMRARLLKFPRASRDCEIRFLIN